MKKTLLFALLLCACLPLLAGCFLFEPAPSPPEYNYFGGSLDRFAAMIHISYEELNTDELKTSCDVRGKSLLVTSIYSSNDVTEETAQAVLDEKAPSYKHVLRNARYNDIECESIIIEFKTADGTLLASAEFTSTE